MEACHIHHGHAMQLQHIRHQTGLPRICQQNSTRQQEARCQATVCFDFNATPATTHMSGAAVAPTAMPCSPAQDSPIAVISKAYSAITAKNKVELCPCHHQPMVPTPINVHKLAFELLIHPNRDFITTLIDALRYGTCIGYTGPEKNRVSHNLISASEHRTSKWVVSANLCKEIQLGCIAGPFPFYHFQIFNVTP